MDTVQGEGVAVVHSSLRDMEEFSKSISWGDVRREVEEWSRGLGEMYDLLDPTSDTFAVEYGRIQGRREAVKYFITLPEVLMSILEGMEGKDDSGRDETS